MSSPITKYRSLTSTTTLIVVYFILTHHSHSYTSLAFVHITFTHTQYLQSYTRMSSPRTQYRSLTSTTTLIVVYFILTHHSHSYTSLAFVHITYTHTQYLQSYTRMSSPRTRYRSLTSTTTPACGICYVDTDI